MTEPGVFTVSLDFELYWGTRDHRSLYDYGENILGGRRAIPAILDLFGEFAIHATWAVVGSLCFDGLSELSANLPAVLPRYHNSRLEPYSDVAALCTDDQAREYYFAPSLVTLVRRTPHQEIGSHTFSHYYCLENGQTPDMFEADLDAMRRTAREKLQLEPTSLVFPRNQFTDRYLALCARAGILSYRGNQRSWVYEPRNGDEETLTRRAIRFADSYVNLTGHHGYGLLDLSAHTPVDIPASRFLRPVARKLRLLEPLRLRRIRSDLTHAAKYGLLYHLWWHPENFGTSTEKNLTFLRGILGHYRQLVADYGMRSLNMREVVGHVRALAPPDPGAG